MLYGVSLLAVFLCLAALYESWSIPFAVILVVPLGVVGAVIAANLRSLDNNIYLQVGLLTTAGLTAKNAILIVEFAENARPQGQERLRCGDRSGQDPSAADHHDLDRLHRRRASDGAGDRGRGAKPDRAWARRRLIGGMITALMLVVFFVPLFFVLVSRLFGTDKKHAAKEPVARPQRPRRRQSRRRPNRLPGQTPTLGVGHDARVSVGNRVSIVIGRTRLACAANTIQ